MVGFCPQVEFRAILDVETVFSLRGAKSSVESANFLLDFFPFAAVTADFFFNSLSLSRVSFIVGTDPRACSEYHFFLAMSSSIDAATPSTAVGGDKPRPENSSKTSMFRRKG